MKNRIEGWSEGPGPRPEEPGELHTMGQRARDRRRVGLTVIGKDIIGTKQNNVKSKTTTFQG